MSGCTNALPCDAALVAGSGYCCPEGSTLNNIGECCAPGVGLDACGACGSSGVAIDFLGRCCTGMLDAAGICCPLPLTVDQFGICGGFSNSGVISLNLTDATAGMLCLLTSLQKCINKMCANYGRSMRSFAMSSMQACAFHNRATQVSSKSIKSLK